MAENHEIRVSVDARQADQGLRVLDTALARSSENLNKFDQRARQTFENLDKASKGSDFSRLAREVASISSAGTTMAAQMNAAGRSVSSAFNQMSTAARAAQQAFSFGNVTAAGRNLQAFARIVQQVTAQIRGLSGVNLPSGLAGIVHNLGTALAGFRAPSQQTMVRMQMFFNQLSNMRINGNVAGSLAQIGAATAGFRSVSTGAVNNLLRLITGLSTANAGQMNAAITALTRLNGLSFNIPGNVGARLTALQNQINQLRRGGAGGGGGGGGILPGLTGLTSRLANATSGMMGMQNSMNLVYQASSLLRVAMGAITLGSFVQGIFDAGTNMQSFQRKIEAVSPTIEEAKSQFAFLADITKTLPIPLAQAQKSFANFAASARLSGQSVGDIQEMFKGIGTASAVFKLRPEQFENVMVAFEQMFNKGQVMSEELKRQLGQYLPAAVEIFAFSMGKTTKEFTKMMQNGQVGSENVKKFIATYAQIFGPMLAASMVSARNQMTLFQNAFTGFQIKVSESGFDTGLAALFNRLTQIMSSPTFTTIAERIGQGFRSMFISLGALASVAADNADGLLKFGAAVLSVAVAFTAVKVALAIFTSPLLLMIGAIYLAASYFGLLDDGIGGLLPTMDGMNGKFIAIAAGSVLGVIALTKMTTAVGGLSNAMRLGIIAAAAYAGNALGQSMGDAIQAWTDANPEAAKKLASESGNKWTYAARVGVEMTKQWWTGEGVDMLKDATKPAENVAEESGASIFDKMGAAMKAGTTKLQGFITGTTGDLLGSLNKYKKTITDWDLDAEFMKKGGQAAQELLQKIYRDVGFAQDTKVDDIKKALQRKLDPITVAIEEYKTEVKNIESLNKAFHIAKDKYGVDNVGINDEMAKKMQDRLDYVTLKARNPMAATVRDMKEEFDVLKQTGDARQIESQLLQLKNKLMAEGYVISTQELDVMRNMLKARQDLERGGSNGFSRWASGVKDLRESLIDVEKNGVDKLSDALADLSVGAEVNFQKIGLSLLRMFNKAIIDDMLKSVMSSFKGNSPLASLFGLKGPDTSKAVAAADTMADASYKNLLGKTTTANMQVQAGVVNVSGANFGVPGATGGFNGLPGGPQVQQYGDANGLFPNATQAINQRSLVPGARMGDLPTFGPGSGMTSITPDNLTAFANAGTPLTGGAASVANQTLSSVQQIPGSMTDAIKKFEGFSAKPYGDFKQTSIGYGTKALPGETSISRETADLRLNEELSKSYASVDKFSAANNINMPGGTRDALASLTYNSGTKWQDAGLGSALKGGDFDTAKSIFQQYNKAGGEVNPGLVARRQEESSWFGTPGFGSNSSPNAPVTNSTLDTKLETFKPENQSDLIFQNPGEPNKFSTDTFGSGFTSSPFGSPTGSELTNGSMFAPTSTGSFTFGTPSGGSFGAAPAEALAPATAQLQNFGSEITQVGAAASQSVPSFDSLGTSLSGLFSKLGSAGGGGGGGLFDMFGGGAGLFKEGGLSTSPVSSYSSGTSLARRSPGTDSINGGFPAILHDNEAVIPLTRGREVPVQMNSDNRNGGSNDGKSGNTFVLNLHGVQDFDSFKKSKGQMKSEMHSAAMLAAQKNN